MLAMAAVFAALCGAVFIPPIAAAQARTERTVTPPTVRFDADMAAAYLASALPYLPGDLGSGDFPARAEDAFMTLLGESAPLEGRKLGQLHAKDLSAADRARIEALWTTLWLLDEATLKETVEGDFRNKDGEPTDTWRLHPGARRILAAWWRAQDPLPATPPNERLREHLTRMAYARAHFASPLNAYGYDERGLVYIALGEPYQRKAISFDDPKLLRLVRQSTRLTTADFPASEMWVYSSAPGGYYLFAELVGMFELVRADELIPRSVISASRLRTISLTEAVRQISAPPTAATEETDVALITLRILLQELSRSHSDFAEPYVTVASYADAGPAIRSQSDVGRGTPAFSFINQQINTLRVDEQQRVYDREDNLPRQLTEAAPEVDMLPLVARTARFLTETGATETRLYWGAGAETVLQRSLPPPANAYLVQSSAARLGLDYLPHETRLARLAMKPTAESVPGAMLPAQTLVLGPTRGLYHVRAQWDVLPIEMRAETVTAVGGVVARATMAQDSLMALSDNPADLVLSDLVPVAPGSVFALPEGSGARDALTPYPFAALLAGDTLGLYFEAYHLAFGADDQTDYAAEYEVRREGGGRLLGLFSSRYETATSVQTRYTGSSRTAREALLLPTDASWLRGGEETRIEVVLRVRDETTGREAERTLAITLLPR